jgi:hypothetical protein
MVDYKFEWNFEQDREQNFIVGGGVEQRGTGCVQHRAGAGSWGAEDI